MVLPRIRSSVGWSLHPEHDLRRPERVSLDEQSECHFRDDNARWKKIDGEFLPTAETATHASLFCNLIDQSKQNTWIWIRQTPSFHSNYINLWENKSFLSSHVQLWPIQTTESNYTVLVCLFYLAGCSANNVLLHLYGQVFGTFQVTGRSCNLMYTILQH